MTPDEQIQLAADLIETELRKRDLVSWHPTSGYGTLAADCLFIARRLHEIWMFPGGPQRFIKDTGEVAALFRDRHMPAQAGKNEIANRLGDNAEIDFRRVHFDHERENGIL